MMRSGIGFVYSFHTMLFTIDTYKLLISIPSSLPFWLSLPFFSTSLILTGLIKSSTKKRKKESLETAKSLILSLFFRGGKFQRKTTVVEENYKSFEVAGVVDWA